MTTSNQNTLFVEIGRRAASQWLDASIKGEGGDALAALALYLAARTCTFTAIINTGSAAEPVLEHIDFELADVATDPRNADGSVDGKLKQARTVAIADKVFGVSELDNAFKQRIRRALQIALYLYERNKNMDDEKYFAAVSTRVVKMKHAGSDKMTTCLVVPYGAVFAPPAEDADEEEKQHYERNKDAPQTLHGRDKASLNELRKRANPPKATRDSNGQREQDAGRSFNTSLDFVSAIISQCVSTDPEAECEVALNREQRMKLFALSQSIAALFAADPLTDEETAEPPVEEEKKAA
jgi:hypothetical protein